MNRTTCSTGRYIASALALGLAAVTADAGSITDANYTISASASGSQLTTTVPGAVTFADGSGVNSAIASITGGTMGQDTNPGTGFGNNNGGITNWFVALPGNSITINFSHSQSYFGLLWGSLDADNTITFENNGTAIASYTGLQLVNDNIGAQYFSAYASYIGFQAVGANSDFNQIILSGTNNPFESDNLATNTPVPLPAGFWLLLSGGAALLGVSQRGRLSRR